MNNPSIRIHIFSEHKEVHQVSIDTTPYIPRIGEKIRLKFGDLPQPLYKKIGLMTDVKYAFMDRVLQEIKITVEVLM